MPLMPAAHTTASATRRTRRTRRRPPHPLFDEAGPHEESSESACGRSLGLRRCRAAALSEHLVVQKRGNHWGKRQWRGFCRTRPKLDSARFTLKK